MSLSATLMQDWTMATRPRAPDLGRPAWSLTSPRKNGGKFSLRSKEMEDVLFCPNCGAKTLEDQDDWDYRGGEKYLCRSCNTVYQMECEGVEEPTVEEDPKEEYRPVISFAEACTARMLE